jgi:hypothetical protein
VAAGRPAAIPLPGRPRQVTVRAVDEQGNLGRAVTGNR